MLDFFPMSADILLKVAGYTSLDTARELACHITTVGGNDELINIEVLLVKHDAQTFVLSRIHNWRRGGPM
jgi:hypothetical protein